MSTFMCDNRGSNLLFPRLDNGPDTWLTKPNGDRCCSYCGSLHPEDFADICNKYADGVPGYSFDLTAKNYERYAHRAGVQNASQGGIKFYGWHAPEEGTFARTNLDNAHHRAIEKFSRFVNP